MTMVALDGGTFRMGSVDAWAYPADGEGPIHVVELSPFRIDAVTVSTTRFAEFVEATGHVTEAERFGWSFVFAGFLPDDFPATRGVVGSEWWRQVEGADWRHPEGPQSGLDGRAGPSRRPRVVERRPGVLRVERDEAADGGRVGVRRSRRPARHGVPVGRRARTRRRAPDERVPGRRSRWPTRAPTASPGRRPSTPSSRTGSACTT